MIVCGDALSELKKMNDESIHCVITSPPYWGLRDYQVTGQLGLEKTPEEYTEKMTGVFHEIKRVLRDDGTVWLNLGDSYFGGGFGTSPGGNDDFSKRYPKQASNRGTMEHEIRKKLGSLKQHHSILKTKDLCGIPWRVAFALQADGWYLRSDVIWHKPNPMPESVQDRPTKAHEYMFLLTKSDNYFYDAEAIMEPSVTNENRPHGVVRDRVYGYESKAKKMRTSVKRGGFNGKTNALPGREAFRAVRQFRNKRSVWTISTKPYKGAHFAVMPEALVEPCILAGSKVGDTILDPFSGSGTVGVVAKRFRRQFVGIELNLKYVKMSEQRISITPEPML